MRRSARGMPRTSAPAISGAAIIAHIAKFVRISSRVGTFRERPSSGAAYVLGRDVSISGDFVRRNIGYMPDFFGVYEDLTVFEYLEFFASAYGLPCPAAAQASR